MIRFIVICDYRRGHEFICEQAEITFSNSVTNTEKITLTKQISVSYIQIERPNGQQGWGRKLKSIEMMNPTI